MYKLVLSYSTIIL